MLLRVWMVVGSMILIWGMAENANSDELLKENIINFQVYITEPTCQIDIPSSIDFGETDALYLDKGIERDFDIILSNCTQRIPEPAIIFSGDYIDSTGRYIKNRTGGDYARGVVITLNHQSNEINLKDPLKLDELSVGGEKRINIKAIMKSIGNDLSPGLFNSNIEIRVVYN